MAAKGSQRTANLSSLIFGDGTPKKAFLTALIVGTLLTTINHGDIILQGQFPPIVKVLLTYCVPYCVTTWGAVTGKMAQMKHQNRAVPAASSMKANSS